MGADVDDQDPVTGGRDAPRGRTVDARKTRRALSKLRRAVAAAETGAGLSAWEAEFAESVEARLEAYGSAFTDPAKGALEEPLSARQAVKLREIARQAKPKSPRPRAETAHATAARGLRRRGGSTARVRDVDADLHEAVEEAAAEADRPLDADAVDHAVGLDARGRSGGRPTTLRPTGRPALRLVAGGRAAASSDDASS